VPRGQDQPGISWGAEKCRGQPNYAHQYFYRPSRPSNRESRC